MHARAIDGGSSPRWCPRTRGYRWDARGGYRDLPRWRRRSGTVPGRLPDPHHSPWPTATRPPPRGRGSPLWPATKGNSQLPGSLFRRRNLSCSPWQRPARLATFWLPVCPRHGRLHPACAANPCSHRTDQNHVDGHPPDRRDHALDMLRRKPEMNVPLRAVAGDLVQELSTTSAPEADAPQVVGVRTGRRGARRAPHSLGPYGTSLISWQ